MRRLLWASLALAFALPAWAVTATSTQYQHIKNTWNAPNSTYVNCSATVTTNCLNTYTYTAIDPNGGASIVTIPNGGIAAGGLMTYTWGPGGFLYCGTWTLSVVANYADGSGAVVSSSPDTATTVVSCPLVASPATNLSATPAP